MKRKIVVITSILIVLAGIFTYNYIYKEHRNIAEEEVIVSGKALSFHSDFMEDQDTFNAKYLNEVFEIEGEITELDATSLVLSNNVYVVFMDTFNSQIPANNILTIKGRYVGYDDLLEVLKIDQATVVDK